MKGGLGFTGLIMIFLVAITGFLIFTMYSTGITSPYYYSLPEASYIDLLSTYYQVSKNAERGITLNSKNFFETVKDYPIKWKDLNTSTPNSFISDFEDIFAMKLLKMANKYLNSIVALGRVYFNFDSVNSVVAYDGGANPKLKWNYTYRLDMYTKLYTKRRVNVFHKIDTKLNISHKFDFLDLGEVYSCGKKFFENKSIGINSINYIFDKQNNYEMEDNLESIFNEIFENIPDCKNFDKEIKVYVSCESAKCECKKLNESQVILTLKNENAAIAFSGEFNNFGCGKLTNACNSGSDCGTRDCIQGFCGNCWEGTLGAKCSPKGSADSMANYRCYLTDSNEYKCLRKYENLRYLVNNEVRAPHTLRTIKINCGEAENGNYTIEFSNLPSNYYLSYNGVKITSSSKKINLCDPSKIPRYNGNLNIYIASDYGSETYYYKYDEIFVRFYLTDYLKKLNEFGYEITSEECKGDNSEIANNFKQNFVDYLKKELNLEDLGYELSMDVKHKDCNEKYVVLKVDFTQKSGSSPTFTSYYIIKVK